MEKNNKRSFSFLHLNDDITGFDSFGKKRTFNFTLCGLYENGELKVGFSSKNPEEKCNNKKLANKIAFNRALIRPTHIIKFDSNPSGKELRESLKQAAVFYKKDPAYFGNKNNFVRINNK